VSPAIAGILILVPTDVELQLAPQLGELRSAHVRVEVCGFGPLAAAARTAELLSRWQPQRVLLLGIAGAIDARLGLGTAYQFREVACFGIGVGSGSAYRTVTEMGWQHWPSDPTIGDTLPLATSSAASHATCEQLLTVCAASGGAEDVAARRQKFPAAAVEDMEGFAVAVACCLAATPLNIVRGISNVAGDRQHKHWQTTVAMQSATQLATQVLEL
jgi:futalosine hydrolase